VAGVYIDNVNPYSAANDAGIKRGDVIVGVNDNEIQGSPQFMEQVGQLGPGDKIKVDYIRNGRKQSTRVTLSSRQDAVSYVISEDDIEKVDNSAGPVILEDLGIVIRELSSDEKDRLTQEGIFVESIVEDSKIARTNMKDDYIITSVNGVGVASKKDLMRELSKAEDLVVLEGYYEDFPGEYPYAFHKD
jgi:S1-C subfamily serine protease